MSIYYSKYQKYKHLYLKEKYQVAGTKRGGVYRFLTYFGFNKRKVMRELIKFRDNETLTGDKNLLVLETLKNLLKINFISRTDFNNEKKMLGYGLDINPNSLAMRNIINQRDYTLSPKPWSSGTYGLVYKAKTKGSANYNYTVKINKNPFDDSYYDYEKIKWEQDMVYEMAYYYLFGKKGIGPGLPSPDKSFYFQPELGMIAIVTRLYHGDLKKLIINYRSDNDITRQEIETLINQKLDTMLDLGILCFDMKPQNVLVDWRVIDNKIIIDDLVLTDFGRDWCCNTRFYPKCNYLRKKDNFINKGNNKYYLKLLMLFSLSVSSQYPNYKLFGSAIDELDNIIDNQEFLEFINQVCGEDSLCESIRPPFHYFEGLEISYEKGGNAIIQKIKGFIKYFKNKYKS